jgi:hypothetical protein
MGCVATAEVLGVGAGGQESGPIGGRAAPEGERSGQSGDRAKSADLPSGRREGFVCSKGSVPMSNGGRASPGNGRRSKVWTPGYPGGDLFSHP